MTPRWCHAAVVVISPWDRRPQNTKEATVLIPVPPISYCRMHRRLVLRPVWHQTPRRAR